MLRFITANAKGYEFFAEIAVLVRVTDCIDISTSFNKDLSAFWEIVEDKSWELAIGKVKFFQVAKRGEVWKLVKLDVVYLKCHEIILSSRSFKHFFNMGSLDVISFKSTERKINLSWLTHGFVEVVIEGLRLSRVGIHYCDGFYYVCKCDIYNSKIELSNTLSFIF